MNLPRELLLRVLVPFLTIGAADRCLAGCGIREFDKCYYMVIINQRDFPHISIQISSHELGPAEKVKCVGVYIDNKLKFLHQSAYIAYKVSRSIGILYRLKDVLPPFVLPQ